MYPSSVLLLRTAKLLEFIIGHYGWKDEQIREQYDGGVPIPIFLNRLCRKSAHSQPSTTVRTTGYTHTSVSGGGRLLSGRELVAPPI